MEFGVTYAVVIQNADFQDASGLNFTGLGTLDNGLYWFTTATRKQMDLRTHIEFMTEYDERRLKDTMDMPRVDSFAQLRRLTLVWAIGEAKKILADPYGLPVESDLQLVVDELTKDRFEPRGVPFGDPWVCQDFQSHMLQSVGFTCQPAVQKSAHGVLLLPGRVPVPLALPARLPVQDLGLHELPGLRLLRDGGEGRGPGGLALLVLGDLVEPGVGVPQPREQPLQGDGPERRRAPGEGVVELARRAPSDRGCCAGPRERPLRDRLPGARPQAAVPGPRAKTGHCAVWGQCAGVREATAPQAHAGVPRAPAGGTEGDGAQGAGRGQARPAHPPAGAARPGAHAVSGGGGSADAVA